MTLALDDVCKALKIDGNNTVSEVVAMRIIELANAVTQSDQIA